MRDDNWLLSRLDHLWSEFFADISQVNPVHINFGRFARLRFGSIKMEKQFRKTRKNSENQSIGKTEIQNSGNLVIRFSDLSGAPSHSESFRTIITITGMFKDEKIPVEVVDHTIAHELCHYAHGFSSPHSRLHRFPHEGGVVSREMENRGLIHLIRAYKSWIKGYRDELKEYYMIRRSRVKVRKQVWRWG